MKPKFLFKVWDVKNFSCEDETMPCFMFSTYYTVDDFVTQLSNRLNTEVTKSSYLGYKIIYVKTSKYRDAIHKGIDIILNNKYYQQAGVFPLNCYNEKCYYNYVQIIEAKVDYKWKRDGDLKPLIKLALLMWKRRLSKLLQMDVEMDVYLGRIRFYVKRTSKSFLLHDKLIDKIRISDLIYESPFNEYALLDYYGEFIK